MVKIKFSGTVIVADGTFPTHVIPLGYINFAKRIICCDGSTENLVLSGIEPDAIVGDMDSLSEELANKYADRIFVDESQDTNDLTKAVTWCTGMGYKDLVIVGATGKREDHTIGNISLLAEYIKEVNVTMVTDTGIFLPLQDSAEIGSFPGQQISIFSINPKTEITTSGLLYPLNKTKIKNWWVATLNEATEKKFKIEFTGGPVLIYLKFKA